MAKLNKIIIDTHSTLISYILKIYAQGLCLFVFFGGLSLGYYTPRIVPVMWKSSPFHYIFVMGKWITSMITQLQQNHVYIHEIFCRYIDWFLFQNYRALVGCIVSVNWAPALRMFYQINIIIYPCLLIKCWYANSFTHSTATQYIAQGQAEYCSDKSQE